MHHTRTHARRRETDTARRSPSPSQWNGTSLPQWSALSFSFHISASISLCVYLSLSLLLSLLVSRENASSKIRPEKGFEFFSIAMNKDKMIEAYVPCRGIWAPRSDRPSSRSERTSCSSFSPLPRLRLAARYLFPLLSCIYSPPLAHFNLLFRGYYTRVSSISRFLDKHTRAYARTYIRIYVRRGGVGICTCVIYTLATHPNASGLLDMKLPARIVGAYLCSWKFGGKNTATVFPDWPSTVASNALLVPRSFHEFPSHSLSYLHEIHGNLAEKLSSSHGRRINRTALSSSRLATKKPSTDSYGGSHYTSQYGDSSRTRTANAASRDTIRSRKREIQGRRDHL